MGRDTKPQLFTKTLRKYLRGQSVSNPSDASKRVENRLRYTFSDFNLLPMLDPEERAAVFEFQPLEEGLLPDGFESKEPTKHDIVAHAVDNPEGFDYLMTGDFEKAGSTAEVTAGTYNLLRFLYLGYRDNGRRDEFFTLLETAIKLAEADKADIPSNDIDVSVDVQINVDTGFTTES